MESSPGQRLRENLSAVVSVIVTGIWLGALVTGRGWWLPALLLGYVVVVPLTGILFEEDDEAAPVAGDDSPGSADEALAALRRRYANGELTDDQFERKVERLLETETFEDVEDAAVQRERE